jgi:hypothetical protein
MRGGHILASMECAGRRALDGLDHVRPSLRLWFCTAIYQLPELPHRLLRNLRGICPSRVLHVSFAIGRSVPAVFQAHVPRSWNRLGGQFAGVFRTGDECLPVCIYPLWHVTLEAQMA